MIRVCVTGYYRSFEGIEHWSRYKPMLNKTDIRQRALSTIELLIQNGVQAIRTHTDITNRSHLY